MASGAASAAGAIERRASVVNPPARHPRANKGKLKLDKYKRTLGVLRVSGRDVAKILIAEQLGVTRAGEAHRLVPTAAAPTRPHPTATAI
jgi:hypothetical protein